QEYWKRGYTEVTTPNVYNMELWEISGHAQHYREDMFRFDVEGQEFGALGRESGVVCPGHGGYAAQVSRRYQMQHARHRACSMPATEQAAKSPRTANDRQRDASHVGSAPIEDRRHCQWCPVAVKSASPPSVCDNASSALTRTGGLSGARDLRVLCF
ncbi:unnamed protein product, partial [Discosporangium mesarthrocarpum]